MVYRDDGLGFVMADLGAIGTRGDVNEDAYDQWPTDRLDPAFTSTFGVRADLAENSFTAQPWNQTGAASGQPVVGASIQIG